jgi:hypothetical protein
MYKEYFNHAELALAAYANGLNESIETNTKLKNGGFSTTQADAFILKYTVIDQHTDATGLSATIFANDATGETFLAIRGTQMTDPGDLLAGLSLAIFGSTVLQPQYASLKTQVQAWLNDGTLPSTFTVTGHSLGGFLAMGLANNPVFAANVSHAYLYNAPGMGGIVGSFADMLLGFMGLSPTGDSNKINHPEQNISQSY